MTATGYGASAYAIPMEPMTWPWDPRPYPWSTPPYHPLNWPQVEVVSTGPSSIEVSRELIEALVRQATHEIEDRVRDLEKRAASAEARVAELEARR